MASSMLLPSALLGGLGAFGLYTLHIIGGANGLFGTIDQYASLRLLPHTTTPWPQWIPAHDKFGLPGTLLNFFWPCVEPQSAAAALSGLVFAGQAIAGLTAVIVEGYRRGNVGKVISYTTMYGQLMQFSGFGLLAPLFLALHLMTAETAPDAALLAIDDGHILDLRALPPAMVLGFIVPTVAMAMPQPEYVSLNTKVGLILLWQFFPVLVYIEKIFWKGVLRMAGAESQDVKGRSPGKKRAALTPVKTQLGYLRYVYAFALTLSATAHFAVIAMSVTSYIAPGLFASPALAQSLSPMNLFVPNLSPMTRKVADVGAGSLNFLQWDYAIGSAAHLIWAIVVTAPTRSRLGSAGISDFSFGNVVIDIVVRSVLLGPLATALTLIWERDEAVFSSAVVTTKAN